MNSGKSIIHGMERYEIEEFCRSIGTPGYRADQIWRWLYIQGVSAWQSMKNLPVSLRDALAARFELEAIVPLKTEGKPGDTQKILVGLNDGEQIEEVLIPAQGRRTVCVSTQVGCRYRCAFCASGQSGFMRNLEAGEIVEQVMLGARTWSTEPSGKAQSEVSCGPTHVVFMGIGEPLDNYDAVLKSVRIINDTIGLNIGARRITISTCGIIPGIKQLMEEGIQVELSVSLHAPNNALRTKLMPVNRKYPLAELIETCRAYTEKTGRIVTFEYALICGVNDSRQDMEIVAELLKSFPCRMNLIPLSPVEKYGGRSSSPATANRFMEVLGRIHINATLRSSKGASLKAACGQLRAGRSNAVWSRN